MRNVMINHFSSRNDYYLYAKKMANNLTSSESILTLVLEVFFLLQRPSARDCLESLLQKDEVINSG